MAAHSLSEQKLAEMEAEMNRFEEEIAGDGPNENRMIIGAQTFNKVKQQITGTHPAFPSGNLVPPPPPPSHPMFMPPQIRGAARPPPPPPPMGGPPRAPPRAPPPRGPPRGPPPGPPPMGARPPPPPSYRAPTPDDSNQFNPTPRPSAPAVVQESPETSKPKAVYSAAPVLNKPKPSPAVISAAPQINKAKKMKREPEVEPIAKKPAMPTTTQHPSMMSQAFQTAAPTVPSLPAGHQHQGQQISLGYQQDFYQQQQLQQQQQQQQQQHSQSNVDGAPVQGKGKKKKEKKYLRTAAGITWEDQTLAEWDPDDFRVFCGDLGNEVTDDTLARAFARYPTFVKAKVVRDKRTNKTKGYGFVSFKDPNDFMKAMREMNGKYVGNRPIKLRKSSWQDRQQDVVKKKEKEKKRLGYR